jgi:alkanesulfonate monooxygenase SsuD/methylene tetrahydromethanopterin reductase-like flavin-dependent oxidoreductase (luciferase family)
MNVHIGFGPQFANLDGQLTDAEAHRRDLELAARAEDVGFDSVWSSEHHFSDYQLASQMLMFLARVSASMTRTSSASFTTSAPSSCRRRCRRRSILGLRSRAYRR